MPSLPILATSSLLTMPSRLPRWPARRRRSPALQARCGAARLGAGRLGALALAAGLLGALAGCGGLTDPKLPAGVPDPASYRTPAGALALYRASVTRFQMMFPDFIGAAGLLTDELSGVDLETYPLDTRIIGDNAKAGSSGGIALSMYGQLHGVRGEAGQALGALAKYDSANHPALMGELYALEGYAELLLADLYCSGIPLSTVEFEGDFVLRAGSTTQQVYRHAVALFDSALALSADSARILNLARVGKGRAYLNLGQYDSAAAAVAAVPDAFRYEFPVVWAGLGSGNDIATVLSNQTSVSDREGFTGLPYRSSGDPRSQVVQTRTYNNVFSVYFPAKYGAPGSTTPLVLASGVEARLIEAEAALHGVASPRGSWLAILNALRTDGTVVGTYQRTCQPGVDDGAGGVLQAGSPCPAGVVDTTWGPGTGASLIPGSALADAGPVCPTAPAPGVACADTVWYKGLAPLADPGSADTRVDLVFRERAYWLFVTGTRQGDLRRLVRSVSKGGYGRDQAQVYPSGIYFGPGGAYGSDVNAPVPASERQQNPKYQGCFNRGA